jgi:hypothetical protein
VLPSGPAPLSAALASEAASASLRFRPGFVYVQGTSVQFRAVESLDGLIGLGGVAHFDEGKAAGPTGVAVRHQVNPIHCAIPFKQGPDAGFRRAEIQVADKNLFQMLLLSS